MSSKVSKVIISGAMSIFAILSGSTVSAGWVGIPEPQTPYKRPLWGPGGKTGAAFMSGTWNAECVGAGSAVTGNFLSIYNHNAAWITAQCWNVPCPPGSTRGPYGGCLRQPGRFGF